MTGRNWRQQSGATPAKLALVGVLFLALIAIVWRNSSATTETAKVEKSNHAEVPQGHVVKTASHLQTSKPDVVRTAKVWPKLTLANVVKHDPFAMPMWYLMSQADAVGTATGSLARSAQVLEELKRQQSKIVVISDDESIAMIGELSLRVGDTIEGFQVTEITTDGIILTELSR